MEFYTYSSLYYALGTQLSALVAANAPMRGNWKYTPEEACCAARIMHKIHGQQKAKNHKKLNMLKYSGMKMSMILMIIAPMV